MTRYVVARADALAPGEMMRVTAGGRDFCLVNVGGEFHALADRCPHAGAPLSAGRVCGVVTSEGPGDYRVHRPGAFVKCPWHGWEFEAATGQSWCDPTSTRARRFDAELVSGADLAKGPYVAETAEVSVEGRYVVINR